MNPPLYFAPDSNGCWYVVCRTDSGVIDTIGRLNTHTYPLMIYTDRKRAEEVCSKGYIVIPVRPDR